MKQKEYKAKKMQDPKFVRFYEKFQPEMSVIRDSVARQTVSRSHEESEFDHAGCEEVSILDRRATTVANEE